MFDTTYELDDQNEKIDQGGQVREVEKVEKVGQAIKRQRIKTRLHPKTNRNYTFSLPLKLFMLLAFILLSSHIILPHQVRAETEDKLKKINSFVEEQQRISKIPGLSVVIVEKGESVFQKGFGYADRQTKEPVTGETLFEIGSTTKAFTALAILQLEERGLLQRGDDVSDYIPWLKLTYNGEPQSITLDQFLYHTSGVAFDTIGLIPETNTEDALEVTVKALLDKPLNRKPGVSYEYATINYDVLGLVIETVARMPYDEYIKQFILEPLDMSDTLVGLHQIETGDFFDASKMATGHKIGFMRPRAYESPIYRGNVPAGYLISNTGDIAKWLNLQVGALTSDAIDSAIIQASHTPDETVEPLALDSHYAAGWVVEGRNGQTHVTHEGSNPNFSSYFILRPDEQVGIAVLSNMNSTFAKAIGEGLMSIWEDQDMPAPHTDAYQILDQILTVANIVVVCLGVFGLIATVVMCKKLARGKRRWMGFTSARTILFILLALLASAVAAAVIMAPQLLLGGLPWSFIHVWAPISVTVTLYTVLATCVIVLIHGWLFLFTRKARGHY